MKSPISPKFVSQMIQLQYVHPKIIHSATLLLQTILSFSTCPSLFCPLYLSMFGHSPSSSIHPFIHPYNRSASLDHPFHRVSSGFHYRILCGIHFLEMPLRFKTILAPFLQLLRKYSALHS